MRAEAASGVSTEIDAARFLADHGSPVRALQAARAFWGDPDITPETLAILSAFAASSVPGNLTGTNRNRYRAWRQNALRVLIYASPDLQTS